MDSLLTRPLGKTGEELSLLGFGGGHISRPKTPTSEALRTIRYAIDQGVTFIDSAWEYNAGRSETLIGEAIRGRRDELFLMTKVCARDRAGAEEQLDESLGRLGTDRIDLWQFHEINYANDHEWIFAPGGAAEAAQAALESGKVRYVGFTGHKDPEYLLSMLQYDFPWTTVQMPINILDASYRSFAQRVLPELQKRGISALGMKSLGGAGQLVTRAGLSPEQCIRFALSQPIASLVSGMDSIEVVDQNVGIARRFQPMSEDEQREIAASTREIAADGRLEWFKTNHYFDSRFHRDQHGFPSVLVTE